MTDAELTELRARFIEALRAHDWNYQYADDSRAYEAGVRQRSELNIMFQQLPDGLELWNAYAPVGCKRAAPAAKP